jgi:hypothetical protein
MCHVILSPISSPITQARHTTSPSHKYSFHVEYAWDHNTDPVDTARLEFHKTGPLGNQYCHSSRCGIAMVTDKRITRPTPSLKIIITTPTPPHRYLPIIQTTTLSVIPPQRPQMGPCNMDTTGVFLAALPCSFWPPGHSDLAS